MPPEIAARGHSAGKIPFGFGPRFFVMLLFGFAVAGAGVVGSTICCGDDICGTVIALVAFAI